MAFLRPRPNHEADFSVIAGRLVLRPPRATDFVAWSRLREESRQHLVPWEPQWTSSDLTRDSFRQRLRIYERDLREDLGYAHFIFRESDDELLGGISLSNVRRGVTQTASLGYWLGARFTGNGYMREAVNGLVPFAFGPLRLHRIEVASMPANTASIKVLERTGFRYEGLARKYLKINGRWQDHRLYACLAEDAVAQGGETNRDREVTA